MKKLLIVESPAKARTIKSYVSKDVEVLASVGHIRDLKTSGRGDLGVDIKNNFKPTYELTRGKAKVVKELKEAAKDKQVILATDPDREGEAIAWHLASVLDLDLNELNRVEFKEITRQSVTKELENLKKIDINLVKSQETRRIVDRIIGFKLSDLVRRKIRARSAGRVQSVALKLVVELEEEIQAFIPEEYFDIKLKSKRLEFNYISKHKDLIKEEEANIIKQEAVAPFTVTNITTRERISRPRPAYITSTLQQDANNQLRFTSARTMRAAQQLYEGVEINGEVTGLITYMRTDSNRISTDFIYKTRDYIKKTYGDEYLGYYKSTSQEGAQDAHEAIRPTDINLTPDKVEQFLEKDQQRLYRLIYERTLEAMMANSKYEVTEVVVSSNNHSFITEGVVQTFKGFTIVKDDNKDKVLPKLELGDTCDNPELIFDKKETLPPARYSEASLIKKLEQLGIGRPSTYAHIMSTLRQRDYVVTEKRRFVPTSLGMTTSKALSEWFDPIINYKYTQRLENVLDEIAEGKNDRTEVLNKFYNHFKPLYDNAITNMKVIPNELTGTMCPQCGKPLEYKHSSYGRFIGCSGFPSCRYTENIENERPRRYKKVDKKA